MGTPREVSKHIFRLIEMIASGPQLVYLVFRPHDHATPDECVENVREMAASAGGELVICWLLWECPNVVVEAEFHAVWLSRLFQMSGFAS